MLDTDALLARLKAKGIKNVAIAKALGLPDSRVPEIYQKKRKLKLDEAVKLVRAFGLEPDRTPEVPPQVLRLAVLYIASELGVVPTEDAVQELMLDARALAEFAADPTVAQSVQAAEGFFRAMRLRRRADLTIVRPESDPATTD